MKRKFISLFAACMVLFLAGCGGSSFTDDEIMEAAANLIAESIPVNEIYFGKGLAAVEADSEAAAAFAKEIKTSATHLQYLPVDKSTGYDSVDRIKEATEKVYSASYCVYLYEMAFTGISDEGSTATYARYMETEGGTLAVRKDFTVIDTRTYDADVQVVRKKGNSAVVKVQSYVDGKEDAVVEVQMIYEKGAWRLDSPTY